MTQELQTFIDELMVEARTERVDEMAAMAEVVDIPLRPPASGGERCEYVLASGERCRVSVEVTPGSAEGQPVYCQMHLDWMELGMAQWGIPFPEDAVSLQQFLLAVMDRLMSGRVRMGSEKAVADVCKMIARNVRGVEGERKNL